MIDYAELAKINEAMKPINEIEKNIRIFNEFLAIFKNIHALPNETQLKNTQTLLNSLEQLEQNSQTQEAVYTIPYNLLKQLTNDKYEVTDESILELINNDNFKENLLEKFDQIEIGEKFKNRKNIIEEAFNLYKLNYFSGCLCLLYSQLEGIMTDYLFAKNLIEKYSEHGQIKYKKFGSNEKKRDNKISGLFDKIKLCKDINDNFLRLETYRLNSDENIRFSESRNKVIHGSNIESFNAINCFTTFIWINSIIQSIHESEINKLA